VEELIEMSIAVEVPHADEEMRAEVRNLLTDLVASDPSLARRARRLRGEDG
jgi:hypothetical protein